MSKLLSLLFGCFVAGLGVCILAWSVFFCIVYGHGNLDAGNFHRCIYQIETNALTGNYERTWDENYELTESTEANPLARIDTWLAGSLFVMVGAGIVSVCCFKPTRMHRSYRD